MSEVYQKLKEHFKKVHLLQGGSSIISWDMETMMPPHAADERAEILATLSAVIHEKATAPQVGEWLNETQVSDEWDVRNLQLLKQDYALRSLVPEKLVFRISELQNKTTNVWQEAKPDNDWKKVEPYLTELFDALQEEARIYADILGCAPYDAKLFQFARGNNQALIDPLFASLKQDLPELVRQITDAQRSVTYRDFVIPQDVQKIIARDLAEQIGYDFNRGRLDVAAHPFSGGTAQDSRITTRYNEKQPLDSLYGMIHEVGHALYSQALPQEWAGQPVGGEDDMSLHESQSLITERHAGLSDGFIAFLYDFIVQRYPDFAGQGDAQDLKNTLRRVRPSFIRVEADEVTYPLHVILRYEIEKKLFSGDARVADIPALWNDGFKELFGLDVPEHRLGCMQDIHWFWGMVGYFPTYTQGALYAAQLFDAMKRDVVDVERHFAQGNLVPFNNWLRQSMRCFAQRYNAPELMTRASGQAPDASFFINHLKQRYLG